MLWLEVPRLFALLLAGSSLASGAEAQRRNGASGIGALRSRSSAASDGRESLVAGMVLAQKKISNGGDDFPDALDDYSQLGTAIAPLGDLDGDGIGDLAIGVRDGLTNASGAVWILFLDANQDVKASQKIAENRGGFTGHLDYADDFGGALAAVGDIDGDGVVDLAVGAPRDDGAAAGQNVDYGAIWVLLLRTDGTVKAQQKICTGQGGFTGELVEGASLGSSLAALGDLDGDGVVDLAAAVSGAVWAFFLDSDGTVKAQTIVSDPRPGRIRRAPRTDDTVPDQLTGSFGTSLATLGDLDGDGVIDLAVGGSGDDMAKGAVWVLFLRRNGSVKACQKIDELEGGFTGDLDSFDYFGISLATLGDLDGDGFPELAVGAVGEDDGGSSVGAVWILFLRADGTLARNQKISATQGAFTGALSSSDWFGYSVAAPGDVDVDGSADLVVGALGDDDGGPERGAVWLLHLDTDATVQSHDKVSDTQGGFVGTLEAGDRFGSSVARIGDLDGDGVSELAAGARDDDGGENHGALWVLSLDGIATLDFEGGGDQARTPFVNGQDLSASGFGRTLDLAGSGANLGPAIFDSTPGGPNDPGPGRALLVDQGKLLVLQDAHQPAQSSPGIFDRPLGARGGGTITLTFPAPIEPRSLDLFDVSSMSSTPSSPRSGRLGAIEGASRVRLFDTSERSRVYSVPIGWTESLTVRGLPGLRTLDLTTLDPQPGFASTARASETPGFDAGSVVRIEVELAGSGALDNLRWTAHPAP